MLTPISMPRATPQASQTGLLFLLMTTTAPSDANAGIDGPPRLRRLGLRTRCCEAAGDVGFEADRQAQVGVGAIDEALTDGAHVAAEDGGGIDQGERAAELGLLDALHGVGAAAQLGELIGGQLAG